MIARVLRTAAIVAVSTWSLAVRADGSSDLEGLLGQSVVTTASNSAETDRDAPATVTVITGEAMRKYGARSLAEAMDMLGLGTISAQGPDSGEMGARGVMIPHSNGEHFLLLINGQRIVDMMYGSTIFGRTSGVPLELVDHIEVILGPGSVLYGSNAMLGVVNVVTKQAKDFAGAHVGVESDLFTSVRPWAGYGTPFKLLGVDGEVAAEFEYYKQWGPSLYFEPVYGGVDPATGKLYRYTNNPVGTGIWGGALSTQATTIEASSLLGRVRLGKFELSLGGQVTSAPTGSAPSDFGVNPQDFNDRLFANLAYVEQVTPVLTMKARIYANFNQSQDTLTISRAPECPMNGITCRVDIRNQGINRGLELTPSFDWFKNSTFVTMIGANADWRTARSLVDDFNAVTAAPVTVSSGYFDHSDVAVGAYLQQTWNPVPWLGFNAGGRLDYDQRFSPVTSPRLAFHVDPWQGGTLKAIYSEAFRAPSFAESYFSYPSSPVSEGLQPERERSVEGSIEQRFDTHRILVGTFATQWNNLIQYYQFSPAEALEWVQDGKAALPPQYQYRNLSSVNNWGFNAAFDGSQADGKLEYGVNLTAAVARLQGQDGLMTPLEVSPTLFGNVHAAYHLPGQWPTLALAVVGQGKRAVENAFESGFSPVPYMGPQMVLRATVSGAVPPVPGLSYRLTGFYSTTDREPFLAGPSANPSANYTRPALLPIDRARVTLGLQYEF